MSIAVPSAPPIEEEHVTYPHLSDISNNTLQYILPPITMKIEKLDEKKKVEETPPVLPPLVVHKIQEDETLVTISLKYGVTEEAIKIKNRMTKSYSTAK